MSDISVLIQGPLSEVSLGQIPDYQQYGEVIVSCWDNDPLLDILVDAHAIKVVKPMPNKEYYVGKMNDTFSYQIHSVYNGLMVVETPYVVRTRSDEFYNLKPLIEKFRTNVSKIVCGNIFFKKWDEIPEHFGDHIFISNTNFLQLAYKKLIDSPNIYNQTYCAEQAASRAMLDVAKLSYCKQDFIKLFDVIDINFLKPFIASWQHGNKVYINNFEDASVIKNIEDL